MRRVWILIVGFLVLGVAVSLRTTSRVRPVAYRPPAAPVLSGPLAPNRALADAERLADGALEGPEDVELGPDGSLYVGVEDGTIRRLDPSRPASEPEIFARTGGRPLGLDFDRSGTLWVADSELGLVSVDPEGRTEIRASRAAGVPLGFADDVDTGPDGRVYLSDASTRFGPEQLHLVPFDDPPTGRLIALDPAAAEPEVLLDDLYFANGVAVSRDNDFVLVAETFRYRIRRCWLAGPRAGQDEIFAENLPGFPDGVAANDRGGFWVALYTVRNRALDRWVHPRPWLKHLIARLPAVLTAGASRYGLVIELDAGGRVLRSLHDPDGGRFANVTSAEEWDGVLYLGSIRQQAAGRLRLD